MIRMTMATVYQISNIKTGHAYVGSTTQAPTARWGQHLRALRRNTHSKALQPAWNESHITDWAFRILETAIPLGEQRNRELFWIAELCPLYNLAKNVSAGEIHQALLLRSQGSTLRAIAKELNRSLGWASKVTTHYRL